MRLSEAIRIGASWSVQAFHTVKQKGSGGTCALGAAYEGTFGSMDNDLVGTGINEMYMPTNIGALLENKFTYLRTYIDEEDFPIKDEIMGRCSLAIAIIDLNDNYHWSREAIADWVEQLEHKHGWKGFSTPEEKINEIKAVENASY